MLGFTKCLYRISQLPLLKNSSAFKNGLHYPSTNIYPLIAGIASGLFFDVAPNPRVKTRGYNIAAPTVRGCFQNESHNQGL